MHKTETKRFILRNFEERDLDDLFEMESDPEVHLYLGNKPVESKDKLREIMDKVFQQYAKNGFGRWAVEDKVSGKVVGWSGLKLEEDILDEPYFDVGYRLNRKYWRQGIATETAIESLRYGFEEMDMDKICAGADIHNVGSNKILQRIGLKPTGNIQLPEGEYHWYELSKDDWLANQG